jgi:type VI secretion system protein ImpG
MDPRLLRHYNDELGYLREMGAEFAHEFPKIASRLAMDGVEVADPYVERLLEGFAFMAARIQLKIEAEQPRLVQHLLECVYPGFLSPVPSMLVARFRPDLLDPNLVRGYAVPRGSALISDVARGLDTHCEFRTAHDVTLWPIEIAAVQYFSHAPDLPIARLPPSARVRGGLRIRLRAHGGLKFNQLPVDQLAVHIAGADDAAFRLHELVLGHSLGTWVGGVEQRPDALAGWSDASSIDALGFVDSQALLPETLRGFSGYRLLQEYAALPQRFMFFRIGDLRRRLARIDRAEVEIVLLFARGEPSLESLVDAGSLALFCAPAVNLFAKRLDRIQLAGDGFEHHVVPDRTRPMDYEVHSIESVIGYGSGQVAEQRFTPLYATFDDAHGSAGAHFVLRREPRVLSSRQRRDGTRSTYVGQEVFVALVDPANAPYSDDVRQLSVSALVTNRDLPTMLPGISTTWTLDAAGPAGRVETLRGPTRPHQRVAEGDVGWTMVSLLTLNYLSLAGEDAARAAAALRRLLALHGPEHDAAWSKQLDAIRSVDARPVVRRLPFAGPLAFGCGVEASVEVDELGFQGGSAFLLGSVLERFFARHASANTFCQTVLRSASRGELMRWPPRVGTHAVF